MYFITQSGKVFSFLETMYIDKSFYSEKNCCNNEFLSVKIDFKLCRSLYASNISFLGKYIHIACEYYIALYQVTCPYETVKPKNELWIWIECRISPILQQNFIFFLRSIIASLSN